MTATKQSVELPVFDQESSCVKAKFEGFIKLDQFKTKCEHSISLLEKHGGSKILVDTSEIKVMTQENQAFIQEDWFPRAIAAGLQKLAHIVPENIFGQVSVESANKGAEEQGAVQIQYFMSEREAMAWLNE